MCDRAAINHGPARGKVPRGLQSPALSQLLAFDLDLESSMLEYHVK